MGIRDIAIAACQRVVPSRYPDAAFQEMTGGKFAAGFGSSCGFLASYVLMTIGCRDARILNREVDGLVYTPGDNISRLVHGAQALGCWRTLADGGTPLPGDIPVCSNGPPSSEHTFVFESSQLDASGNEFWTSYDGGSPTADSSSRHVMGAGARERIGAAQLAFIGGPRGILGYIDLDLVPLDVAPLIPDPAGGLLGGGPLVTMAEGGLLAIACWFVYEWIKSRA